MRGGRGRRGYTTGGQFRGSPYRRGAGAHRTGGDRPIETNPDFDFDSANARFDKDAIARELEAKLVVSTNGNAPEAEAVRGGDNGDAALPPKSVAYNKSLSFFDNLSFDAETAQLHTYALPAATPLSASAPCVGGRRAVSSARARAVRPIPPTR